MNIYAFQKSTLLRTSQPPFPYFFHTHASQGASTGFQVTAPSFLLSSAFNSSISLSDSSKSKTCRLEVIRPGRADLGRGINLSNAINKGFGGGPQAAASPFLQTPPDQDLRDISVVLRKKSEMGGLNAIGTVLRSWPPLGKQHGPTGL